MGNGSNKNVFDAVSTQPLRHIGWVLFCTKDSSLNRRHRLVSVYKHRKENKSCSDWGPLQEISASDG